MAYTPHKPRKTASSFEIEPIFCNNNNWRDIHNTSWSWALDWWASRDRAPVLIFRWHTYAAHAEKIYMMRRADRLGRE